MGGFVCPLLVIVGCYAMIIRIFRISDAQSQKSTASKSRVKLNKHRHNMLINTTLKAVVAFCIGWTPYAVMAILGMNGVVIPPEVQISAGMLAKLSTTMNMIVYAYHLPDCRAFFEGRLNCLRSTKGDDGDGDGC